MTGRGFTHTRPTSSLKSGGFTSGATWTNGCRASRRSTSLETKACVVATDISLAALAVAKANARRLDAQVKFVACDVSAALADSTFDVIVSNPPYVAERDRTTLPREVRDHEPALALFGGDNGLAVYPRLISDAARLLRTGG